MDKTTGGGQGWGDEKLVLTELERRYRAAWFCARDGMTSRASDPFPPLAKAVSSGSSRSLSENSICALKLDRMDKVYGRKTLRDTAHFKYTGAILGQAPRCIAIFKMTALG